MRFSRSLEFGSFPFDAAWILPGWLSQLRKLHSIAPGCCRTARHPDAILPGCLCNKRCRLGPKRAVHPVRFQNGLTRRIQDLYRNIHAHLPCHQAHELARFHVHRILVGLSGPQFALDHTVRFQLPHGLNRTGVLSNQPGSRQELKDKDHPTAANESHRNWTGGYSIDESDFGNTELRTNTVRTNTRCMPVRQIAESLGAGTSGAPVPHERYRQISLAPTPVTLPGAVPGMSRPANQRERCHWLQSSKALLLNLMTLPSLASLQAAAELVHSVMPPTPDAPFLPGRLELYHVAKVKHLFMYSALRFCAVCGIHRLMDARIEENRLLNLVWVAVLVDGAGDEELVERLLQVVALEAGLAQVQVARWRAAIGCDQRAAAGLHGRRIVGKKSKTRTLFLKRDHVGFGRGRLGGNNRKRSCTGTDASLPVAGCAKASDQGVGAHGSLGGGDAEDGFGGAISPQRRGCTGILDQRRFEIDRLCLIGRGSREQLHSADPGVGGIAERDGRRRGALVVVLLQLLAGRSVGGHEFEPLSDGRRGGKLVGCGGIVDAHSEPEWLAGGDSGLAVFIDRERDRGLDGARRIFVDHHGLEFDPVANCFAAMLA